MSDLVVVFEDDHLLVVDKPAFLPTTSPSPGEDNLADRVRAYLPQGQAHPTSRLDAPVTGLVTFAKTKAMIAHLTTCREHRAYQREYWALAQAQSQKEPLMEGQCHVWTDAIGMKKQEPKKRFVAEGGMAADGQALDRVQAARTEAYIQAGLTPFVRMVMRPQTGRTHQLRVHAAFHGFPLLGDVLYGGPRKHTFDNGRILGFGRVMLHCATVAYPRLPPGDASYRFVSAPPSDMVQAANAMGVGFGDSDSFRQT